LRCSCSAPFCLCRHWAVWTCRRSSAAAADAPAHAHAALGAEALLAVQLRGSLAAAVMAVGAPVSEVIAVTSAWHVWLPAVTQSLCSLLVPLLTDVLSLPPLIGAQGVVGLLGGHSFVFATACACVQGDSGADEREGSDIFLGFPTAWLASLVAPYMYARLALVDRAQAAAVQCFWAAHTAWRMASPAWEPERLQYRLLHQVLAPAGRTLWDAALPLTGRLIVAAAVAPLRLLPQCGGGGLSGYSASAAMQRTLSGVASAWLALPEGRLAARAADAALARDAAVAAWSRELLATGHHRERTWRRWWSAMLWPRSYLRGRSNVGMLLEESVSLAGLHSRCASLPMRLLPELATCKCNHRSRVGRGGRVYGETTGFYGAAEDVPLLGGGGTPGAAEALILDAEWAAPEFPWPDALFVQGYGFRRHVSALVEHDVGADRGAAGHVLREGDEAEWEQLQRPYSRRRADVPIATATVFVPAAAATPAAHHPAAVALAAPSNHAREWPPHGTRLPPPPDECSVCLSGPESFVGGNGFKWLHGEHFMCTQCLVGAAQAATADGTARRLPFRCPLCVDAAGGDADTTAATPLVARPLLEQLLAPEALLRLDRAECHLAGLRLVYCPSCREPLEAVDLPVALNFRGTANTAQTVTCPVRTCRTRFCMSCERLAHPGRRCAHVEAEARSSAAAGDTAAWAQAAAHGDTPCPCGEVISRNGGCYHMQHAADGPLGCRVARERGVAFVHFCAICGGEVDPMRLAAHFPSGPVQPSWPSTGAHAGAACQERCKRRVWHQQRWSCCTRARTSRSGGCRCSYGRARGA
jgi:hypothetical protein